MVNRRSLHQKRCPPPRTRLSSLVQCIRHTHQPTESLRMLACKRYLLPRLFLNHHTTVRAQRIENQRTSHPMKSMQNYRHSRGCHMGHLARQTEFLRTSHLMKYRRRNRPISISVKETLPTSTPMSLYQLNPLHQFKSLWDLEIGNHLIPVLAQPILHQAMTTSNHSHETTLLAAQLRT